MAQVPANQEVAGQRRGWPDLRCSEFSDSDDLIVNRVLLYWDRRDFVIE